MEGKEGRAGKYLSETYKRDFNRVHYDRLSVQLRKDGHGAGQEYGIDADFLKKRAAERGVSMSEYVVSRLCYGMAAKGEAPSGSTDGALFVPGETALLARTYAERLGLGADELLGIALKEYLGAHGLR